MYTYSNTNMKEPHQYLDGFFLTSTSNPAPALVMVSTISDFNRENFELSAHLGTHITIHLSKKCVTVAMIKVCMIVDYADYCYYWCTVKIAGCCLSINYISWAISIVPLHKFHANVIAGFKPNSHLINMRDIVICYVYTHRQLIYWFATFCNDICRVGNWPDRSPQHWTIAVLYSSSNDLHCR